LECHDRHHVALKTQTGALVVSVGGGHGQSEEGFTLSSSSLDGKHSIIANTPSGGLYGAFRFLSFLQQHKPIPSPNYTSSPALKLRAWDLWDTVSGAVEQGHDGNSLVWPYAIYQDDHPPPRSQLFLSTVCNSSDPFQQWEGTTFTDGKAGPIQNAATGNCLTSMACNPVLLGACSGPTSASWIWNDTNHTLAVAGGGSVAPGNCASHGRGGCLDLNRGTGPDIDIWACHGTDNGDYVNQRFLYNETTRLIQPEPQRYSSKASQHQQAAAPRCLTVSRTAPLPDAKSNDEDPWDPHSVAYYRHRVKDLLRFLKSSGINTLVLNDVNACGATNDLLLGTPFLTNWTANLAPLLERYAITPMLALCFAAPTEISNITSDPLASVTIKWWESKFAEIHKLLPTFGGVVVKADSEGNVGPMSFNRTESDGANMLARALLQSGVQRGVVLWRAFIYGDGLGVDPSPSGSKIGHEDLARQADDTFCFNAVI